MSRMRCFRSIFSLLISVGMPSRFTLKGSIITYPPFGDRNWLWAALNIRKREQYVKGNWPHFLISRRLIFTMDKIPARQRFYIYRQANVGSDIPDHFDVPRRNEPSHQIIDLVVYKILAPYLLFTKAKVLHIHFSLFSK